MLHADTVTCGVCKHAECLLMTCMSAVHAVRVAFAFAGVFGMPV
jgi:hypothetical protein